MHVIMTNLKFNVAQLLREMIGARREHTFTEAALPLDETLVLRDISGHVVFTRTATGVFVDVHAQGQVRLTCVRSLEEFDYPITIHARDEFHSVIDVVSGSALPKPPDEDPFFLDELHMADVGEAIRTYTLLELPLNPISPTYRDTPVRYSVQSADTDEATDDADAVDHRLAVLKTWLRDQREE